MFVSIPAIINDENDKRYNNDEIIRAVLTPYRDGIEYNPSCLSKSTSNSAYTTSRPAIHIMMAQPSINGINVNSPVAARYPPIGAAASTTPKYRCDADETV
jgi:hypothetical protein